MFYHPFIVKLHFSLIFVQIYQYKYAKMIIYKLVDIDVFGNNEHTDGTISTSSDFTKLRTF